ARGVAMIDDEPARRLVAVGADAFLLVQHPLIASCIEAVFLEPPRGYFSLTKVRIVVPLLAPRRIERVAVLGPPGEVVGQLLLAMLLVLRIAVAVLLVGESHHASPVGLGFGAWGFGAYGSGRTDRLAAEARAQGDAVPGGGSVVEAGAGRAC